MVVTPLATLSIPSSRSVRIPSARGRLGDHRGRRPLDGVPLDGLADGHHLVQRQPTPITGLRAGGAARPPGRAWGGPRRRPTGSGPRTSASGVGS